MKLTLQRTKELPTGTLGTLSLDGTFECYTLERPTESSGGPSPFCIPTGIYRISLIFSNHFQTLVPWIMDVPGRTNIEIHPANWITDLLGCIAVGQNQSDGYVGMSRAAFSALMEKLEKQADLSLEVK